MIFLYRLNGGKVVGVSVDANAYAGIDPAYSATVTNPPTPNGADLSVPKIYDGVNVRNATVGEQATFVAALATDTTLQERASATAQLTSSSVTRKVLRALVDILAGEISTILSALPRPIISITRVGTVATVATAGAHGLAYGATVYVHGCDVTAYNGAKPVTGITSNTFTYDVAGSPATPATGSMVFFPSTTIPALSRTAQQALTAIQNRIADGTYD